MQLLVFCLALGLVTQADACLWDRDTIAHEAQGVPEAIDIIVGRFERNPPLYYQMRRDRALELLKREPANLAAYDDAGVACDRLGDDDQAIDLMQKKAGQLTLSSSPEKTEQLYREEANLGTFYIHRWIRRGAHRDNMNDVDLASQHIQEAIRINPNAHFGRERYQLQAIEWIRTPPRPDENDLSFPTFLQPQSLKSGSNNKLSEDAEIQWEMVKMAGHLKDLNELGLGDAVQGLSGLIALGNAWESIDVFHALGLVLKIKGRSTISYLAQLRIEEIIDHGGHSILPQAYDSNQLKEKLSYLGAALDEKRKPSLVTLYSSLRSSAEKWQANRTAFMEERLKKGLHPDTDPDFWAGYKEVPHPALSTWRDHWEAFSLWLWPTMVLGLLVIVAVLLLRAGKKLVTCAIRRWKRSELNRN